MHIIDILFKNVPDFINSNNIVLSTLCVWRFGFVFLLKG